MLNLQGIGTCVTGLDSCGRPIHVCFAPDTPEWYVEYVSRLIFGDFGPAYNLWTRWSQTSYGSTDIIGTPIRLRWSVVPDGTHVPHFNPNINPAPSNLIATLNIQFGNRETWWNLLRQSFARWSPVAGLRYEEVGDDGASFPYSSGSPARGDVRIGGRALDGPEGVLAFNYFPDWGDMVIDISEDWADPANNFRRFRNVVMHEHGHGLGLGHVIPTDCTKLMEPYLCTNFDGPQDDDIRGAQRLYGDRYETNDRFERATPVSLGSNDYQTLELSLHNIRDVDWLLLQIPRDTSLTITAVPIGATYAVGPEGGNPVTVNTRAMQDLVLELRAPDARTILMMANTNGRGGTEQITNYPIPGGGSIYLRVYSGSDSLDDVQRYELRLRSSAVPGIFIPLGFLPDGRRESEAYGVSWDGNVVVGRAKNSAGHWRAVRWTLADGQILDLGTLGGNNSAATAVSADGRFVVGWSDHEGYQRAFRWTAATGMQDIGALPGDTWCRAYAVSADGRIVVGQSQSGAFIWTPETGMQYLGHAFAHLIPPGWELVMARGISPDGRFIVGWGRNPQGQIEAWLLDPVVGSCELPGDVNRDQVVDDGDLLAVLFAFGSSDPNADQNNDGVVDDADLLIVLFNFGSRC